MNIFLWKQGALWPHHLLTPAPNYHPSLWSWTLMVITSSTLNWEMDSEASIWQFCLWGRSNLFHFKCRSHFVFSPASISCEMAPFSAGIKASRHFITFLHFLHQSRSHLSLSLLLSFSFQSDPTCLVEWFSLSTLSKRTNYVYVARIKITRPVENVNKLGLKCTWTVTDYREV